MAFHYTLEQARKNPVLLETGIQILDLNPKLEEVKVIALDGYEYIIHRNIKINKVTRPVSAYLITTVTITIIIGLLLWII